MSRNWKTAGGPSEVSFKWDEKEAGFKVEGYLFDKNTGLGKQGNSTVYTVLQQNKEKVVFWGSAVLDDRIAAVGMGVYFMVTYNGKTKSKSGSLYHSFTVQFDDSDIMDMSANDSHVQDSPVENVNNNTAPEGGLDGDDDLDF